MLLSVHPRSRGEHVIEPFADGGAFGSSPLARGTRFEIDPQGRLERFIPARAGNTTDTAIAKTSTSVHPRSRGEHTGLLARDALGRGSSPLARGTLGYSACRARSRRFIPARAGNTFQALDWRHENPVHPRSRGEHFRLLVTERTMRGSSPLARGTRRLLQAGHHMRRFIPARAGNTIAPKGRTTSRTVHPRSRGEHLTVRYSRCCSFGSSPLARGTRSPGMSSTCLLRFIPARAGNTQ